MWKQIQTSYAFVLAVQDHPKRSKALLAAIICSVFIWTNCGRGGNSLEIHSADTSPALTISTTSLSFEAEAVGARSSAQSITLQNTGSGPLQITGITVTDGFVQTNVCGSGVPAGANCVISIVFAPQSPGDFSGELTISDNAAESPQQISLSGSTNLSVSITPQASSVTFKQIQQFKATVTGGVSNTVNWTVDGVQGGNSTVGTISASGVYAPPAATGPHAIAADSTEQPSASASAQITVTDDPGVFTEHNSNQRTGQDLKEIVLTPDNVNQNQFGKLFSLPIDGYMYAQPLYVENLKFPDDTYHNTLFAATEHDSVYAFDADQLQTPLWKTNFINPPSVTTMPYTDIGCRLVPETGITSTPAIDPASNTIYVVAKTKELADPACTTNCSYNYYYKLHALDLTTGAEKFGGPVTISATVPGTGSGSDGNGHVAFDAFHHLQRSGLLLLNGVIYIGFASYCDIMPYHGWLFAYDATTLKQLAVFNTTPNGGYGGIWQSGGGIVADSAGDIYLATGNGTFDADSGGADYGDTVLKMRLDGTQFTILDYFTPYNQDDLNAGDIDLGSGTPVLLPDQPGPVQHLITLAGKEGRLYLLDADHLGGFHADADQIVQSIPGAFVTRTFGAAAFWDGQAYFTGESDHLKSFTLSNGKFSTPPLSASGNIYRGSPSISANNDQDGIVWVLGNSQPGPTILDAYDARNIATKLYGSDQAGSRDQAGPPVQFTVPTIANGKVYVPTKTEITVYGLLPN